MVKPAQAYNLAPSWRNFLKEPVQVTFLDLPKLPCFHLRRLTSGCFFQIHLLLVYLVGTPGLCKVYGLLIGKYLTMMARKMDCDSKPHHCDEPQFS